MGTTTPKDRLRREFLATRRALADELSRRETAELCRHLPEVVTESDQAAGYIPVRGEPGFPELADTLLTLADRVLVPIARTGPDGAPQPLQWADYRADDLVDAPYGLREPPGPWLPPSTLGTVRTVFVPALAVDLRGVRLGRGAGFYDRSLGFRHPDVRLIAVVRDEELVDALPAEPHDVPMTHALTPRRGLVALS